MNRFISAIWKSFLFTLFIVFVMLISAWRNTGKVIYDSVILGQRNVAIIRTLSERAEAFQEENNRLPETLGEVIGDSDGVHNQRDISVDAWQHPIEFENDGATVTLRTKGRDDLPGGTGLDRDITNHDWPETGIQSMDECKSLMSPDHKSPQPSLKKFLFEMPTRPLLRVLIIVSLLSFSLGLLVFGVRNAAVPGNTIAPLLVILVLALFVGYMLSLATIPNNH